MKQISTTINIHDRNFEIIFGISDEKIYNEKDKLKEMSDNGFKYTLNNFTIDVCLDKLEKLF